MTGKRRDRRLSAILAADIAGYTKLVEKDTDGTVVAWRQARAEVIDPSIVKFGGRIVKHTGDGFLAEFETAHEAVQCAIAMQGGLTSSPLEFRMGISLGDVVDDGDDIHGEGVNIATRIEGLADHSGICVSAMIFEAAHNQLGAKFQDLGVAYLLEGSVQRAGNRVRITVQLIETDGGAHIWADRYDGSLDDIFDLQDQITEQVAGALQPSIRRAEIECSRRKRPQIMGAYDYTMRALSHVWMLEKEPETHNLKVYS